MSARDDYPNAVGCLVCAEAMYDEIDSLRAEVDRLENDIDGHRQHYTCTPERMAP